MKKRIAEWNGGSLAEEPSDYASAPVRLKRLHRHPKGGKSYLKSSPESAEDASGETEETIPSVEALFSGYERDFGAAGRCYCVETTMGELSPEWRALEEGFLSEWENRPAARLADLKSLTRRGPEGFLYLDTETLGLSHCMIFLVGVMEWADGRFRMRQFMARSAEEEAPMLLASLESVRERGAVVSFNGKSFDMPLIGNRAAYHGLRASEEKLHVDLLHHARREWRSLLPNCRLQTLEAILCGRTREGDTPSAQIPAVYRRYLADGDPRPLQPVLYHNLLDLATMAELVLILLGGRKPFGAREL